LAAIAGCLWLVFSELLAVPVVIAEVFGASVGLDMAPAGVVLSVAVSLFALLWFARLEPAHQLVSIHPHLGLTGVVELVLISACGAWTLVVARRRIDGAVRWLDGVVVLGAGCLIMTAVTTAVEPSRRSDAILAELSSGFQPQAGRTAGSNRVLVI